MELKENSDLTYNLHLDANEIDTESKTITLRFTHPYFNTVVKTFTLNSVMLKVTMNIYNVEHLESYLNETPPYIRCSSDDLNSILQIVTIQVLAYDPIYKKYVPAEGTITVSGESDDGENYIGGSSSSPLVLPLDSNGLAWISMAAAAQKACKYNMIINYKPPTTPSKYDVSTFSDICKTFQYYVYTKPVITMDDIYVPEGQYFDIVATFKDSYGNTLAGQKCNFSVYNTTDKNTVYSTSVSSKDNGELKATDVYKFDKTDVDSQYQMLIDCVKSYLVDPAQYTRNIYIQRKAYGTPENYKNEGDIIYEEITDLDKTYTGIAELGENNTYTYNDGKYKYVYRNIVTTKTGNKTKVFWRNFNSKKSPDELGTVMCYVINTKAYDEGNIDDITIPIKCTLTSYYHPGVVLANQEVEVQYRLLNLKDTYPQWTDFKTLTPSSESTHTTNNNGFFSYNWTNNKVTNEIVHVQVKTKDTNQEFKGGINMYFSKGRTVAQVYKLNNGEGEIDSSINEPDDSGNISPYVSEAGNGINDVRYSSAAGKFVWGEATETATGVKPIIQGSTSGLSAFVANSSIQWNNPVWYDEKEWGAACGSWTPENTSEWKFWKNTGYKFWNEDEI